MLIFNNIQNCTMSDRPFRATFSYIFHDQQLDYYVGLQRGDSDLKMRANRTWVERFSSLK